MKQLETDVAIVSAGTAGLPASGPNGRGGFVWLKEKRKKQQSEK